MQVLSGYYDSAEPPHRKGSGTLITSLYEENAQSYDTCISVPTFPMRIPHGIGAGPLFGKYWKYSQFAPKEFQCDHRPKGVNLTLSLVSLTLRSSILRGET